ncbi:hypothetical protein GJV14_22760, partial [Enterobacteriaceae bacterium RIT697]|nr:hypothetical protein [Enterobacteriaceae bacterium RIT697]
ALADGVHTLTTVTTDAAGNTSPVSNSWAVNVDTVAPNAPVISGAWDDVAGGVYNGLVANNGVTNDNRPELRGTAEAGSVVTILNTKGAILGSVLASSTGTWSWTEPAAVVDATYIYVVKATDAAGNASAQSATYTITVDTAAPNAPVITTITDNFGASQGDIANGGKTDDTTPTLKGNAEANSLVTVEYNDGSGWKIAGSVTANASGNWTWEPGSGLPNGDYQFRANATDVAGNKGAVSAAYTLTIVPVVTKGTEGFTGVILDDTDPRNPTPFKWMEIGTVLPSGFEILDLSGGANGTGTAWVFAKNDYSHGNFFVWRAGSDPFGSDVNNGGIMTFTVGNTTDIAFSLSGFSVSSGVNIGTVTYYDTEGNVLKSEAIVSPGQGSMVLRHLSYIAPEGKLIGSVKVDSMRDPGGLGLDNLVWGTQSGASSRMLGSNVDSVEDESNNISAMYEDHINGEQDPTEPEVRHEVSTHTLIVERAELPLDFSQLKDTNVKVTAVDMVNSEANVLNISLGDVLAHGEEHAFTADNTKQLMIKGDEGDVVNLSDLLPDGTDPGNWAKAEGTVTVGGVQYEVYQHEGTDTELLIQQGVQTNLNNH